MKTLSMITLLCCVSCASTNRLTEDQAMNAQVKQMEKDADDLGDKMRASRPIHYVDTYSFDVFFQAPVVKVPEVVSVEAPQPQPYYELDAAEIELL